MDGNMDDKTEELQLKASGLSTSFTISFEDSDGTEKANVIKQKRIIKTANMFTKKHYRTLSLPVANNTFFSKNDAVSVNNGCDSKTKETTICEDNLAKDITQPKGKPIVTTGAVINHRYKETSRNPFEEKVNRTSLSIKSKQPTVNLSDTESEGGTYTIDKDNEQVKEARKSIDQVFGISSENQNDDDISSEKKMEKRTRMVDEWIEQNVSVLKTELIDLSNSSLISKSDNCKAVRTSKIPFPIERSRESSSTNLSNGIKYQASPVNGVVQNAITESKNKQIPSRNLSNCEELDTEHYLRETENIVCALQKRIIRNDMKPQLRLEESKTSVKDQNGKETAPSKYSVTRFNRAFSLRRDRSKKPTPVITSTTIPARSKTFVGTPVKTVESMSSKTIMKRNNSFCKDYLKQDNTPVKPKSTPRARTSSAEFNRKPSTKSTQEIELHNWKRRKNYDPLKAVAEEKKRKALAGAASNSASSAHLKQISHSLEESDDLAAKIITRSASFHGLRNKNGYEMDCADTDLVPLNRTNSGNRSVCSYFISSNEDATECGDNDSEDHWVIPKPPSTSLQNTPPESISSRLSLLSNAASNSSGLLLTSSTITNVDSATVSKVTQMSYKVRDIILAFAESMSAQTENPIENFKDQSGLLSVTKPLYDRECGEIPDNICNHTDDLSFIENDVSADYQLNSALNNLNEIYQAVQKLHINCAK